MEATDLAEQLNAEIRDKMANDESTEGPENAFTEVMLEYLEKSNEIDSWELGYARRQKTKNAAAYKINAWNLHGSEGDENAPLVDLFVCIHLPDKAGQSVPKSDISEHFALARSFLEQSINGFGGKLHLMEESAPPYEAAQTIHTHRESLDTARIFLLTNGTARAHDEKDCEVNGVEVKHYLWDFEKLRRLLSSGQAREVIELDLAKNYGGAVPCLAQDDGTGEYTAYLAFFPARLLADIYGTFGPRLLEKNVRSFLQARGKVNKGIQATIREKPHRFLAYNNGISGTAESVTVSRSKDGLCRLEHLRDFQIVNGGQTTASIYHAVKKDKADISNVTVQVKLTVAANAETVAEFVPLISLYANSQNKVNVADFSANDAWHHKLEALSRTVWAPAAVGTGKGTHWYYERARGSHLDDKMRAGTPARREAWELENPLNQKFTKTDVAKYEHAWDQKPHVVGKGAEKNFIEWTLARQRAGTPLPEQADFHVLVAKAILFRAAEKIVSALELGGYRANVVAYALSWLARETGGRLDLQRIWQRQSISGDVSSALGAIGKAAFVYLTDTAGTRNVTEWAKKLECWERFRSVNIEIPSLAADLIKVGSAAPTFQRTASTGAPAGKSWGDLFEQIERIKSETWTNLSYWGKETGKLAPWQTTLCSNFHRKLERGKKPTFPECKAALEMLEAARGKGFGE
jgi:hypothetical protein